MQEPTTKQSSKKNQNQISEQISFRHSTSVKSKLQELSVDHNLSVADMYRLVFNEGLKARFGLHIRGNKIIE